MIKHIYLEYFFLSSLFILTYHLSIRVYGHKAIVCSKKCKLSLEMQKQSSTHFHSGEITISIT